MTNKKKRQNQHSAKELIPKVLDSKYIAVYEKNECATDITRLLGSTAVKYPPRRLRALIDSQLRTCKSNTYLWIGTARVTQDIVITRGENNRIYDLRRLRSTVVNIINNHNNTH